MCHHIHSLCQYSSEIRTLIERRHLGEFSLHGVLLGVSGGADSVALAHSVCMLNDDKLRSKVAICHINHKLRGEESDADAAFVQKIADEHGVRFFLETIKDSDWDDDTGSLEADARSIRYRLLMEVAERIGVRYLALAHTADDQVETILHRIIRGTGIHGLEGIPETRLLSNAITLVRPLLGIKRYEILDWLKSHRKTFRTDSSNLRDDFTRNKIRNTLLPMLREKFNGEIDESIRRLGRLAAEQSKILSHYFDTLQEKLIVRETENEMALDRALLLEQSDEVLREIFVRIWRHKRWKMRGMGHAQWVYLAEFVKAQQSKSISQCTLYGGMTAILKDGLVIFKADFVHHG